MEIRAYRAEDAAQLCLIHNQIYDEALTAVDLHDELLACQNQWVGVLAGNIIGYTAISPVPGLAHIRVLRGFIAPEYQRQGLGSQLLQHLIEDLKLKTTLHPIPSATVQLSQCIEDTNSAVYHFLHYHHFTIEHQESHLLYTSPAPFSHPIAPPSLSLKTLPRSQAIQQFIALYNESFSPHPWYQPYTAAEVAASLLHSRNLIFLYYQDVPIGFAWIRNLASGVGEIEPIGLSEKWQGKGYGRFLLQAAMHNLITHGMTRIHIGTWTTNKPAIHLYYSLGFKPHYTLTYLAFDIA